MQNLPSYREQFNKITEAYIRGEIEPLDAHFCFCGTLCDNRSDWAFDSVNGRHIDFGNYTGKQYAKMENALFGGIIDKKTNTFVMPNNNEYEDRLFNGMCAALEVLKQIHIEKGEIIDEDVPEFKKRELVG